MENAIVKIAKYIFVPHIMMFTNKCHLCKITNSYEGQECLNHKASKKQNFTIIKDAKIIDKAVKTVNSILVVTSFNTKAILRIVLRKKIDWTCFCKKISTYFSVPHVMMFTNKCHLCKS